MLANDLFMQQYLAGELEIEFNPKEPLLNASVPVEPVYQVFIRLLE